VELLITILIISILAGLILGVASIAGEKAREAQTRHVVDRLHTLLMDHYDTYKTRRVRLNPAVEVAINSQNNKTSSQKGQILAEARLYALREMILMEVPDRWSDVLLESIEDFDPSSVVPPLYLNARTDLSNVYLRRFNSLHGRTNALSGQVNTADELRRNQGAECLYMVVMLACGDGEARSLFGENSIGDSDGDGAPEFLDGWGRPVNFLRWAPGFNSQIQLVAFEIEEQDETQGTKWQNAANKDHDPFDVFRVDRYAYRLVPLIYSPGGDEDSGLNVATEFVTWRTSGSQAFSFPTGGRFLIKPALTPYNKGAQDWPDEYFGMDMNLIDSSIDPTSTDNIHNHMMGLR
jgi:hypothetical protein